MYEKRTCSTCQELAELLEERGIEFDRVDFQSSRVSEDEIREIVRKTGRPARDLFRAREPVYAELAWPIASRRTTRRLRSWPSIASSCSARWW